MQQLQHITCRKRYITKKWIAYRIIMTFARFPSNSFIVCFIYQVNTQQWRRNIFDVVKWKLAVISFSVCYCFVCNFMSRPKCDVTKTYTFYVLQYKNILINDIDHYALWFCVKHKFFQAAKILHENKTKTTYQPKKHIKC